jgi:hypothetical protein
MGESLVLHFPCLRAAIVRVEEEQLILPSLSQCTVRLIIFNGPVCVRASNWRQALTYFFGGLQQGHSI